MARLRNARSKGGHRSARERERRERDREETERAERLLQAAAAKKPRRTASIPPSDALVFTDKVSKVYEPSPPWMRVLLRSSISSPVVALEDCSIDVKAGEILAVVGQNGAGKSTLFRILTGLTTPTTGRAFVCGLDATEKSHEVRRLIGFAPADEKTLLLRNTCRENLVFHGQLQGISRRRLNRRVGEMLDFVGLGPAADRVGFALSTGMRARLQLARALLHRPRVLILDEPTSSVDPIAAYELLELIKQAVADQGAAALISSHRLEEIEALHNDVVLLDGGLIKYRGNLDSLRKVWEEPLTEIHFHTDAECQRGAKLLEKLGDISVVEVNGEVLTVSTGLGLGELFRRANGELNGVHSISKVNLPLRELLAKILLEPAESVGP